MNSKCLLLNLLILILIQVRLSYSDGLYNTCNGSFSCGTISGFGYPFRRHQDPTHCGNPGFEINCDERNPPSIDIMNITYQILSIDPTSQVLRVIREDMVDSICPQDLVNTTIDPDLFNYTSSYTDSSFLFGCPSSFNVLGIIGSVLCGTNEISPVFLVPGVQGPGICQTSVIIPFPVVFMNSTGLVQVLQEGFELRWKVESRPCTDCTQSGGQCVYDMNKLATTCACSEPPLLANSCSSATKVPPSLEKGSKETARKLILGFSCGFAGILLLLFVILCRKKRLWETRKYANHKVEIFIKNYGTLALKRFNYSETKKITNSFVEILGKGGYGSVYKGQLPDGQLVAVKLLAETQGDGEDFINEVASIGRTSHVNIVTLLGFCIEGKKRALMYEFMPNGSLDKFLRRDGSHLDCNTLFQIAKGIARGLEYLHRGCNTRIVHFDIKPHNILLDEEFVPKISDFGLAKLCKRKESIVSVMGARGTAGYMAPEVFFRSLGGASHKSDVYSYGMMVLEMTGAHKNNKVSASSTSEAYFPDWVYKQIESGSNLGDHGVTTEYEEELARKMMTVSLWCIQSDPSDRPSISKVVEMLEGSFESLQVPPRRFWSSPSRPAQGTSPSATQSSSGERLSRV